MTHRADRYGIESEAPAAGDRPFHVGACLVEPDLNQITGPTGAVRVEPKSMQVLLALVAQANRVVTRQALLDTVWVGTFVEENTLSRCISQLRKALGDQARNPQFIETIPKTGYRLIAPLRVESEGDAWAGFPPVLDVQVPAPASVEVRGPLGRQWPMWLGIGGMLLVALGMWGWVTASHEAVVPVPMQHIPLTSYVGIESHPAFSPDGNRVAFMRAEQGRTDLYVKMLDEASSIRLTESDGQEGGPVWSPDGRMVAYILHEEGRCAIMHVPALGGEPRKLSDCGVYSAAFLDWSPDGTSLVYGERFEVQQPYRLTRLDVATLEKDVVLEPPADAIGDLQPVFSPDGQTLAFIRRFALGFDDLYTVSLEDKQVTRITSDLRYMAGHDWTLDGERLVFSSNRSGGFQLWDVSASGGAPTWLAHIGAYDPGRPVVGPHEGQLAYVEWFYDTNIWQVDLEASTSLTKPLQRIASTRWDHQPQISPDGTRIAFVSNRSGTSELWVQHVDGSGVMRLTTFGNEGHVSYPKWAPDGQALLFEVRQPGNADVYWIDARGGSPQAVTTDAHLNILPSWSAEGDAVLFASNRSGAWQIWQADRTGPAFTQLTEEGGFFAQAGSANEVYYNKPVEPGIWRLDLGTRQETRVREQQRPSQWGNWVVRDRWLYELRVQASGSLVLERTHLDSGERDVLKEMTVRLLMPGPEFSISSDGRSLLFTQIDQLSSDIIWVREGP